MYFSVAQPCGQVRRLLKIRTVLILTLCQLVLSVFRATLVSASILAGEEPVVPGFVIRHGTVPFELETWLPVIVM